MKEHCASIYGLFDASGVLLYIGKSKRPAYRLKQHVRESVSKNRPLHAWIRKHGTPAIRVLVHDSRSWEEDERRLIAEARKDGLARLNVADGGAMPYASKETRAQNGATEARKRASDPAYYAYHAVLRIAGQARMAAIKAKNTELAAKFCRAIEKTREAYRSDRDGWLCNLLLSDNLRELVFPGLVLSGHEKYT